MKTHAEKTQDDKSQSVASEVARKQGSGESASHFIDNRPEAVAQRKMHEMANNNSRVAQLRDFQDMANNNSIEQNNLIQKKENNTGLPDNLKSGIEGLSGYSMDDVKVHRNSNKPAQLQAHAYAQGNDIHLGPGQEKHLAHEAWHVVQQKQRRVKPTMQMKGNVNINDDAGLEEEADTMGAKALQLFSMQETASASLQRREISVSPSLQVMQRRAPNPYQYLQGDRQTAHHILPHTIIEKIIGLKDDGDQIHTKSRALPPFESLTLGMIVHAASPIVILRYADELNDGLKYAEGNTLSKGELKLQYKKADGNYVNLEDNQKLEDFHSDLEPITHVKFIPSILDNLTDTAKQALPSADNFDNFDAFETQYRALQADSGAGDGGNQVIQQLLNSFSEWAGGNQFFGPKSEARAERGTKDDVDEDFIGLAANKENDESKPQVMAQLFLAKKIHAKYNSAKRAGNLAVEADNLNNLLQSYFKLVNAGDVIPKAHQNEDYYKISKTPGPNGKIYTGEGDSVDVDQYQKLDGITDAPNELSTELKKRETKLWRDKAREVYEAWHDTENGAEIKMLLNPVEDEYGVRKVNYSRLFEKLNEEKARIEAKNPHKKNTQDWHRFKNGVIKKEQESVEQAIAFQLDKLYKEGVKFYKYKGSDNSEDFTRIKKTVANLKPSQNEMKAGIYDDLYAHSTGDYITKYGYQKLVGRYRDLNEDSDAQIVEQDGFGPQAQTGYLDFLKKLVGNHDSPIYNLVEQNENLERFNEATAQVHGQALLEFKNAIAALPEDQQANLYLELKQNL